jgi:hypothetical protein
MNQPHVHASNFTLPPLYAASAVDCPMTMPPDARRLNPKAYNELRNRVAAHVELFLRGRETVVIGVTEPVPFMDGTDHGQLHTGTPYRVAAIEFKAMKMDPTRSSKIVVLEMTTDYMTMQGAIMAAHPGTRKQVFLNPNLALGTN